MGAGPRIHLRDWNGRSTVDNAVGILELLLISGAQSDFLGGAVLAMYGSALQQADSIRAAAPCARGDANVRDVRYRSLFSEVLSYSQNTIVQQLVAVGVVADAADQAPRAPRKPDCNPDPTEWLPQDTVVT